MTDIERSAVIYCRVSSKAQTTRGDGLGSQETRCRQFASQRRYKVAQSFSDDMTGSVAERPGMKSLLAFLRKNKSNPHVVIIDDISRLARGVESHIKLRSAISLAGGILESPTVEFGDDADSELQEFILATVAQHHRKKNAEQTVSRMKSRLMNGYWVFQAPLGYEYRKASHGKVLAPKEPEASIIREALEGYASGRFQIQVEVMRFIESHPEFPRDGRGLITQQKIKNLLTRSVYAGMVEGPGWSVSMRKGHHEALVSFATFQKVQERLVEGGHAPARQDLNEDFPLRGFVECGDCGKPLTACWSTSKTGKRHPYYMCYAKGCVSARKSIRRDELEGAFEGLLAGLRPRRNLFELAADVFKEMWNGQKQLCSNNAKNLKIEIRKIEKQIDQLLDRIVDATTPSVITAYEKRIAKLESDKLLISEKASESIKTLHTFEQMFELAMMFLSNPQKLWSSKLIEHKRAVLKLTFSERLAWQRNQGFRTPKISMPFKVLAAISGGENVMAHRGRFELPTP